MQLAATPVAGLAALGCHRRGNGGRSCRDRNRRNRLSGRGWRSFGRSFCRRLFGCHLRLARRRQNIALVDPDLDTDTAKRRVCLGKAVVDVCAKSMQGNPPLFLRLVAGHLRTTQASAYADLDALCPALHGPLRRLFDCTAVGHATLQLIRDVACDKLGIELRLADLGNIHANAAAGQFLEPVSQLLNLLTAATDYDTGLAV